eukprot:c18713_g1_i2 orf=613-990(+)
MEQFTYPVFFLTDGGTIAYSDPRRNSIEAAIEVCKTAGLQGIVSKVEAILQAPEMVNQIKRTGLCLLTYGELNNVPEAFCRQEELGVDGVIVDDVLEIVNERRKVRDEAGSVVTDQREGGHWTAA